jgi:hypothetical protein
MFLSTRNQDTHSRGYLSWALGTCVSTPCWEFSWVLNRIVSEIIVRILPWEPFCSHCIKKRYYWSGVSGSGIWLVLYHHIQGWNYTKLLQVSNLFIYCALHPNMDAVPMTGHLFGSLVSSTGLWYFSGGRLICPLWLPHQCMNLNTRTDWS